MQEETKVCGVFIADTKKVEAFLGKIIIRQLHASSRIDFMFSTYTGIQDLLLLTPIFYAFTPLSLNSVLIFFKLYSLSS